MTPVRPPILPPNAAPQAPARPGADRTAAQRAFFEAALGRTAAPAQAEAASQTPTVHVTRVKSTVDPAPAPDKILRPGSIIDIRV